MAHPEMLTLLNNENLHKGKYVSKSKTMKELSSPALDLIDPDLSTAAFRTRSIPLAGLLPLHIYLAILALNYFYVSNWYTLNAFLGVDLLDNKNLSAWRSWVTDVVMRAVRT